MKTVLLLAILIGLIWKSLDEKKQKKALSSRISQLEKENELVKNENGLLKKREQSFAKQGLRMPEVFSHAQEANGRRTPGTTESGT